jgi:tyrosine-protein kinase Etk/Wzc
VTDVLAPSEPMIQRADGDALGNEQSLRDFLAAVSRRRWVVAFVFLATLAIGAWRTFTEQRIYSSAVTVRVERSENAVANAPSNGPQYDFRVDPLVSEQQVIRSQTVAQLAAQAAGLQLVVTRPAHTLLSALVGSAMPTVRREAVPGDYLLSLGDRGFSLRHGSQQFGPTRYGDTLDAGAVVLSIPRRPPAITEPVTLTLVALDAVARDLRQRITTHVLPQTDIIEISVTGPDPVRVAYTANVVAQVYADYAREGAQARARKRSQFIAQSLEEQAVALKRSQDSLRDFQERNHTSDVTDEQTELFKRVYKLEADRADLVVEQEVYLALVGRLAQTDTTDEELRKLVGTDAVEHNKSVAGLYQNWFELQATKQKLSVTRDERNVDVQAIDSSIAATKRDLQVASKLYLQSLATRIASIDSSVSDLRRESEHYPPMVAEQARLTANVKTREQGYDNLLAQYQLAQISEGGETGGVRILDAATPGLMPISPQRKKAVLLAGVIGLLLGLFGATFVDRLDDSVQTPDEVRERLHIPILGSIPRMGDRFGRTPADRFRIISHVEPQSLVAEAFRSLRTNLAFARAHQDLRTIVLASPGPGDGKSTVACNLATTFAQQGQRTLLIDADLRRAVVNATFDIPRSPGLTEVLVGAARLTDCVRPVDVPNLSVLASGQFPPNPSELLGSPALREMLEEAKRSFDMIVIDSPPVLAVTDASVITSVVDGTIVVVRVGKSARDAVKRAVAQLRIVNGRVLGAVLNDVDFRSGVYYGGYGYYYHKFYGDDSASDMQGKNGRSSRRSLVSRLLRRA